MVANTAVMAARSDHAIIPDARKLLRSGPSPEQRDAAQQLLEGGDLSCLVGYAGAGKSTMLKKCGVSLKLPVTPCGARRSPGLPPRA